MYAVLAIEMMFGPKAKLEEKDNTEILKDDFPSKTHPFHLFSNQYHYKSSNKQMKKLEFLWYCNK